MDNHSRPIKGASGESLNSRGLLNKLIIRVKNLVRTRRRKNARSPQSPQSIHRLIDSVVAFLEEVGVQDYDLSDLINFCIGIGVKDESTIHRIVLKLRVANWPRTQQKVYKHINRWKQQFEELQQMLPTQQIGERTIICFDLMHHNLSFSQEYVYDDAASLIYQCNDQLVINFLLNIINTSKLVTLKVDSANTLVYLFWVVLYLIKYNRDEVEAYKVTCALYIANGSEIKASNVAQSLECVYKDVTTFTSELKSLYNEALEWSQKAQQARKDAQQAEDQAQKAAHEAAKVAAEAEMAAKTAAKIAKEAEMAAKTAKKELTNLDKIKTGKEKLKEVIASTIQSANTAAIVADKVAATAAAAAETAETAAAAAADHDHQCKLCYNNPQEMIIVPCGHYCLCELCATHFKSTESGTKCPICRASITDIIRVHIA